MAEAKVYISGPIVADSSEAGNAYPYTTLEDVMNQLEWQKPFDAVRAIINSPGGRVDKGLGVYDYFRSLPGVTITTEAIGQCSSIANAIFLAGDVRLAHQHVEGLVHLPVGGVVGANAADAQEFADDMADTQAKLIALYVERAGIDETIITALMGAATTLTADELLAHGIATQIVQPATALAILPKHASTSADDADQMPGWATSFMTSIKQGLAAMASAISLAKKPATAQADSDTSAKALDVTTSGGDTLTIDTGDRDSYQEGDTVTGSDGNAVADADYALTDGNTISVASGAITAINPTATDDKSATASAEDNEFKKEVLSAITALAGEVRGIKNTQAAQAKVVNRVAAGGGSNAVASRAQDTHDQDQDADTDPVKAAAEKRKAKREKAWGK